MVSSIDSRKLSTEIDLSGTAFKGFQKAKDFLSKTASQAVDSMSETTHQVVGVAAKTSEQATNSISETAKKSVGVFTEATTETTDAVIEAAQTNFLGETLDRAKGSFQDIQKAESFNAVASESIQGAVSSLIKESINSIKVWVDSHPLTFWIAQVMLWAIHHPIVALIVLLLVVFTLSRLLKVLGLLVEKALISVLQAPLRFGRLLLKTSSKSLSRLTSTEASTQDQQPEEGPLQMTASVQHSQKERLANILSRLEVISQEQHQLLQEVAAIAASDEQPPTQMSKHPRIDQSLKDR